MKRTSALVEFTLTTAMLAFWAIACAAAFQATTAPLQDAGTQPAAVTAAAASDVSPAVTIEASLEAATPGPVAQRI